MKVLQQKGNRLSTKLKIYRTVVVSTLLGRIPRHLLHGELMCGSHKQGRPKLRSKGTLKSKLKWSGIGPRELEATAADRSAWRSLTSRTSAAFEGDRRQRLAAARDRRHRAASASTRTTDHRCDTCGRLCASNFGLRSHMRSHC